MREKGGPPGAECRLPSGFGREAPPIFRGQRLYPTSLGGGLGRGAPGERRLPGGHLQVPGGTDAAAWGKGGPGAPRQDHPAEAG